MGRTYEGVDGPVRDFVLAQHMFFVATAPLAADGHVNLSPKGLTGSLAVLDPHRVAYLDLTGSGAETIAHLRENGRITLMFCAFDGPPRIVRVQGRGRVVLPDDGEFAELVRCFPERPGTRSIIVVDVERVADSCGYAVPLYDYQADREQLLDWAERRGPDGIAEYQAERNSTSIDGLPALG